jgi:uncharacterized protein (UPF0332 family)
MEHIKKAKLLLNWAIQTIEDSLKIHDNEMPLASVNRAYYTIYHALKSVLILNQIESKTPTGLHTLIRPHFVKTGIFPKETSEWITKSFIMRQNVDYDFETTIPDEQAKDIVKKASNFLESSKNCFSNQGI